MEVEKLKNLENVVKPILKHCPMARGDDFILYAEVIRSYNPALLEMPTRAFLYAHDTLKVPNIKSVERARRKLQEKFPELASEKAKRKRAKEQATYISYAKDDDGEFW